MRDRDGNRLSMISVVIDYCEKNVSATSGIAQFGVVLNKVKSKRDEIRSLSERDRGWSKGVTTDLRELRKSMSEAAVRCGSGAAAYAYSVSNYELAERVDFTMEDLRKLRKVSLISRCQDIHDGALANIGVLVNWGVSSSDLSDLQGLITAYNQKMASPRGAIVTRSGANRKIKELVREVIDNLLEKQLDKMAETLRFTNHSFWNGYRMSRNIIDRGIVHTKVKGVVLDEGNVPLAGVKLTVYETGTQKVVREAVSGEKGLFKISPMAVGNFDLKWEFNGYITRTETNVRIAAGKVVRRKVKMKR